MMRTAGERESTWRASLGRIAAAALALGGLSVLAVAPGPAGAATSTRTARRISTAKNSKLGPILVAGDTVYTLKTSKTACRAECLKAWPPVLLPGGTMTATAGKGVDAAKLGTAAAAHGALQVTYSGKRLYWFVEDKSPGQVHGNLKNEWGKWSTVIVPATAASTAAPPATDAPTTAAPATGAPAAAPPATEAPATSPPAPEPTAPPEPEPAPTTSPGTGGVGF